MEEISIIIPVFNADKYLVRCIESVLKELREEDELILINDGSYDQSRSICEKYKCENVRLINNDNHGVSYSRNLGLSMAAGRFIMFVDADDYMLPGWRSAVTITDDEAGDIVYLCREEIEISIKDIVENIIHYPNRRSIPFNPGACWGTMYSRDFLMGNSISFPEELINGEDGIFSLRCILRAKSYLIKKAPEFYYYNTLNTGSATHVFNMDFNKSNLEYPRLLEGELRKSSFCSDEQLKSYVDHTVENGIFVLAYRIASIDSAASRNKCFYLFEQDIYRGFFKTHDISATTYSGIICKLIKDKKYTLAINILRSRMILGRIVKGLKRIFHE